MPKEFEALVSKIKESLRKAHPEWNEERVSSASYATATEVWKKKYGSLPSRENEETTIDKVNKNTVFERSGEGDPTEIFMEAVKDVTSKH